MKKTTVYLTQDQLEELDVISTRVGKPKAQLIREAVAVYLHEETPELPHSVGSITDVDGSLTSENLDEWLLANWHPE